jgi:hypothetical protein
LGGETRSDSGRWHDTKNPTGDSRSAFASPQL